MEVLSRTQVELQHRLALAFCGRHSVFHTHAKTHSLSFTFLCLRHEIQKKQEVSRTPLQRVEDRMMAAVSRQKRRRVTKTGVIWTTKTHFLTFRQRSKLETCAEGRGCVGSLQVGELLLLQPAPR
ncbi:unnamed protein product [Effrenium voratum]|nr:unnamed protein product [Effrenium voratum]CAJ1457658.1 unnamed protein product [Effrenium voratum]